MTSNFADEIMLRSYFEKYDCDDIVRLDQTYEQHHCQNFCVHDDKDVSVQKRIVRIIAKEKRISIESLEKKTKFSIVRLNKELRSLEKRNIVHLDKANVCLTDFVWNMSEKEILNYMYNRP